MPIIPQYRAQGPAGPKAPVMEQQAGPRVDASEAVRGIARLTGALSGTTPVGKVDPNLGQRSAQGVQSIGQGVGDVGSALFDISKRVAEAKNYHDEHLAQIELDRQVGEFEKEKANLPDPTTWEGAWNARMEKFTGQYFTGKNLAPVTQEAIKMRAESFGGRVRNRVISEAERKIVGDTTGAIMSDALRAQEANDPIALKEIISRGKNLGVLDEYTATRMELQGIEQIEGRMLDAALSRADTHAMYGDEAGVRAELESAPFRTPEERAKAIAVFETKTAVGIANEQIKDRLASGEDPDDVRAALEARDEEGNYTLYPKLSPSSRMGVLQPIYAESNAEYSALVKSAADMIESDVIKDAQQLDEHFQGKEIDPATKATLIKKLEGVLIANEKTIVDLQTAAASYDPSNDPDERAFTAQSNIIDITLGFNNPKAESIHATLKKAKNGEPLTLGEDIFRQKAKETSDLRDSAADYQLPASQLEIEERGGRKVFVDYSQEPEEDDPDRFEKETGSMWWKGTKVGRVIHVNQDDRVKLENVLTPDRNGFDVGKAKGIYVTDLKKKGAADSETAGVLNEMKRRADTGDLKPDNWEEEYKKAIAPILAQVAEKELEDVFAPGEDDPGDPDPSKLDLPSGGSGRGSAGLFPELDLQFLESLDLGE
jgi:hypothetical protein